MSDIAIRVEHLGKQYKLGWQQTGHSTLRETFVNAVNVPLRWLKGERGAELSRFWALDDVSFDVKHGEVVGIIGRNGAGKSTLLKVLSRITSPTRGRVDIFGRVGSLLEVGTGFHYELSGRENIYLNGAILGMRRVEINRKFDEIVDFSGVEKFLDTAVKHYSSGMYVRLAFAVAAHLEPEILLVDEVLAVGDAAFQRKCLGKISEVAGEGRTILFVSHNLGMVRSLCPRSIMLEKGNIHSDGGTEMVIHDYLSTTNLVISAGGQRLWRESDSPGSEELRLVWIKLLDPEGHAVEVFDVRQSIRIEVGYKVSREIRGLRWIIQIKTPEDVVAFATTDHLRRGPGRLTPGLYRTSCIIPRNLLNHGKYFVSAHAGIPGIKILVQGQNWISFSTVGGSARGSHYHEPNWPGVVAPEIAWTDDELVGTIDGPS